MFGWDKCFQPMISLQNRCGKLSSDNPETGCKYFENPVGISLAHLEAFDGHAASQVFSIAHISEPAVIKDPPDAYELLLKNIRGGYDPAGFADLGKKPQTSLPEFAVETR
jgi:hypothetical protein